MATFLWNVIASAGATILFSIVALCFLFRSGRHRDANRQLLHTKIASTILLSSIGYTLIIALFGHFYLHIPLSVTTRDYFGDDRVAWLLIALLGDVFARFWALFDP
jgi:predicted permease